MTVEIINTPASPSQLLTITNKPINDDTPKSVDARGLHLFLESGQDFSTWIKTRIEKYCFSEGVDFIQFHNFVESKSKPRIEYALSVDTAKEISMVENNDKGREARKYFIECEKKYRKKVSSVTDEFKCKMIGAETVARMLNYSEASKLEIIHAAHTTSGIDTTYLPAYIEKAQVAFSLTSLLKKIESPLSSRAFNNLLISAGYLEEKERKSTKGKTKKFKALTQKGLAWGQNDVSPQNKLEVQPHYYEGVFPKLYAELTE